jgi:hypothetical protein
MYINPVTKPTTETRPVEKRKKGGGESSFAEQVETLLELDAVDIARPHQEDNQRKDSAEDFAPGSDKKDSKQAAGSADKSVNVTV